MTQTIDDLFLSYHNGNYSWVRDEFWGCNKSEMQDIMLHANNYLEKDDMHTFIKVIFLP